MNNLYIKIKNNYDKINLNNIKINKTYYKKNTKEFNKYIPSLDTINNKSSYIGKEFNKLEYLLCFNFNIDRFNLNVFIYCNINNDNKILIKKILKRIITIFLTFKDNILSNHYNIILLLYYAPRYINKKYDMEYFYKENIFNCTCGWYNEMKQEVIVSRINGLLGLLTHELCHLSHLDFGNYNSFEEYEKLFKSFSNSNAGYFIEGINNAISTLIHCIFLSLEENKNIKEFLKNEYKHSLKQCKSLIDYFDCKDFKELLQSKKYKQNGQVFEYVFLKYIYLSNFNILYHLDNNFKNKYNEKDYYKLYLPYFYKFNIINNINNKDFNYKYNMEYYNN